MKRTLTIGVAFLALLVTTAACGTAEPKADNGTITGHRNPHLLTADVAVAKPSGPVSFEALATGVRSTGYELADRLPATDGNRIYSPASLTLAFAMLREGAVGRTAHNIDEVLHLPPNRERAVNALIHLVADPGRGNVLRVADALFSDPRFDFRSSYLQAIKKWYDAGVHQVGFPTPALDVINAWVNKQTFGRIPHLLQNLAPQARFALVNAVYLKARWASTFDPTKTSSASFTTLTGGIVTAKMMKQTEHLDYAEGPGWQAVRLPYQGDKLSMWVLLPQQQTADPTSLLSPKSLAAAQSGFADTPVKLLLPRWDIAMQQSLLPILQSMGFHTVGDYSGATPSPGFGIGGVVQAADISVGEKGTVAAAATGIVGVLAVPRLPSNEVVFNANHPFAYVIMQNASGVPLFEGTVGDPTQ